jgi:hypothetical protein
MLLVWCIALTVGGTAMAVAGPTDDLNHMAFLGNAAAVQALLTKGADVNAMASNGTTALMIASQEGHLDVVQVLLAQGAKVNAKASNNGATALMIASQKGHLDVVRALLAKGAEVNMKTVNSVTALMLASHEGRRDVVQALLAKGAEVNVKASDGKTALMVATDDDIRSLLVQASAKPSAVQTPAPRKEISRGPTAIPAEGSISSGQDLPGIRTGASVTYDPSFCKSGAATGGYDKNGSRFMKCK